MGYFNTFGGTDVEEGICGCFPAKGSPVVCVHPPGNGGPVSLCYGGQRATFLEPAAYHAVGILVAATFATGEWMTIVAVGATAASWGVFQTVAVGEL